jgi:ketosteroid isomerase-like protein
MKHFIYLLPALILAISCQTATRNSPSEEENQAKAQAEINRLSNLYFEAWENEDLDSTLFFLDEGFINMFGMGMSQTKEECREDWKNVFDTYLVKDVEYSPVELIIDRHYAFETGLFKQKWITLDEQDTLLFDMRGMSVWKKQEDGSWKMFRLMGQQ